MNNNHESRSWERKRKRSGKIIDSYYKNRFILNIVATAAKFSKPLGAPRNQELLQRDFPHTGGCAAPLCHPEKEEKCSDEKRCEG
jgi:hypothetical protein